MAVATQRRSRTLASDEAVAAMRLVLGLTIGVGAMTAAIGAVAAEASVLVAAPTLVVMAAGLWGRTALAGWASVAVWLFLLPPARGEALIAPLAMMLLCLAIAVGPERLISWVADDVIGHRGAARPSAHGWIEEDGRAVD